LDRKFFGASGEIFNNEGPLIIRREYPFPKAKSLRRHILPTSPSLMDLCPCRICDRSLQEIIYLKKVGLKAHILDFLL